MFDDGAITVPLQILLADPALGLTRIAGPLVNPPITSLGTTELADPTPYLVHGELLLTAGISLPADQAGVDDYIARLAGVRIAALGFGVEPIHDHIPDQLVVACHQQDIPLIRVPPETPFVAVGHAFTMAVAHQRQREFAQEAKNHAALVGATNDVDPLRAVVRRLARCTAASVLLIDPHGRELAAGGPAMPPSAAQLVQDCATRAATGQPDVPTRIGRRQLSAHVVPTTERTAGCFVLVLATGTDPTMSYRRTVATATGLLALLVSQRHALAAGAEGASAVVRLMTGDHAAAVEPLLRSAVNAPGRHWVVVRGHATSGKGASMSTERSADGASIGTDLATLRTAIGTPFLDVTGSRLTALIPCTEAAPPDPPADPATLTWTLGYSRPVAVNELTTGRGQADQALRTALANGRPAYVNNPSGATLAGLVPAADGKAFARLLFGPLGDPAAELTRTHLSTLRTWLSCHGSQDRTASTLGIHRNTVRHRLTHIATALSLDLQDPDVRMTLWFALRQLGD